MGQADDILYRLSKIEFHDLPIEKVILNLDNSDDFGIKFSVFQDKNEQYKNWTLRFFGVRSLHSDSLENFLAEDAEIYSFDYHLDEVYNCKIVIVQGYAKPSIDINFQCKEISLMRNWLIL